ncbi:MAG TPA: pyridoxal phosphate-dependent aminotransferase family protein [Chitinivibrionales bacterium]|nr:pyridoxal phosphate-dependent aminotransferase family protein [Chitinivibrionales bacterium]
MKPSTLYQSLKTDLSLAVRAGFNPYYQKLERGGAGRLKADRAPLFDLASNDYLGLAADPRVKAAMAEAVNRCGASFCGTPIAAGYAGILAELEAGIAAITGLESAVAFPSCYQANNSLFSSIAGAGDAVIVDHYAHASLIQGIRASGACVKPFLHNNTDHLEKQLAASRSFRRVFVATESVFSTEGSIAPFDVINDLCGRYDATAVIDDSHGIGVIGKNGRGILEHAGISGFEGIYTASLGKALAGTGGVIAGREALTGYLRYNCSGLIYSTALVPSAAASVLASMKIISDEFAVRGKKMWDNHALLKAQLTDAGFALAGGEAPIAAVMCGSSERTILLAKLFFENGIFSTPFIPPSVPPEQGVLRLIIGAKVDEADARELERRVAAIGCEAKR